MASKAERSRCDATSEVEHIAKFTAAGFNGCKNYWNERSEAKRARREVDQRIDKAATEEMSKARADALKFFQTLLPGEIPLSH